MDHRSFGDMLAFSIGFAVLQSRDLLRRLRPQEAGRHGRTCATHCNPTVYDQP